MFTQEQKSNLLKRFAKADLNKVQDKDLRAKGLAIRTKQAGFTLLELLVVVGILAIIGGAMISNFGGQEQKAARGAATSTLAGVEDAMRIFKATTSNVPNNMESLVCAPYNASVAAAVPTYDWTTNAATVQTTALANGTAAPATTAFPFGGTSNASGIGGGMGLKLADKFTLTAMPAGVITALADVGVVSLRYAAAEACDNEPAGAGTTTVTFAGGEVISADAALQDADIPNHAFEDPRDGGLPNGRNRGRGFAAPLAADAPMMVWNRGGTGYNNKKVGAEADAVLIGMGLGQASDLVGEGTDTAFAKAPFYGQVGKDKYAHYIALVNVGTDVDGDLTTTADQNLNDEGKAFVQAVVDARGDFLDEEFAEFTGQKT